MDVKDMVVKRFKELCAERNMRINELANISGVTPSTAYSMMDASRRDISIKTIKKFCDGLEITLGEFFSTKDFDSLEQEIQ
ncbi:MAG: helix-turn-helix transcriptional regulator [Ruminococcaceae bacterium]|nr:helix-turn-helix transcriptional regulator [Oscillospiraceae bacterium]